MSIKIKCLYYSKGNYVVKSEYFSGLTIYGNATISDRVKKTRGNFSVFLLIAFFYQSISYVFLGQVMIVMKEGFKKHIVG